VSVYNKHKGSKNFKWSNIEIMSTDYEVSSIKNSFSPSRPVRFDLHFNKPSHLGIRLGTLKKTTVGMVGSPALLGIKLHGF
jgi:hypothetical protein